MVTQKIHITRCTLGRLTNSCYFLPLDLIKLNILDTDFSGQALIPDGKISEENDKE